jgi:hypothetical protein
MFASDHFYPRLSVCNARSENLECFFTVHLCLLANFGFIHLDLLTIFTQLKQTMATVKTFLVESKYPPHRVTCLKVVVQSEDQKDEIEWVFLARHAEGYAALHRLLYLASHGVFPKDGIRFQGKALLKANSFSRTFDEGTVTIELTADQSSDIAHSINLLLFGEFNGFDRIRSQ